MAQLTDRAIRSLQPGQRAQRVFDGGGLYLELTPKAGRYWRLLFPDKASTGEVECFGNS